MARPDKVAAVEEIAEKFRGASASVVTEYRGLTMSQLTTLRRSLDTYCGALPCQYEVAAVTAADGSASSRLATRCSSTASSIGCRVGV